MKGIRLSQAAPSVPMEKGKKSIVQQVVGTTSTISSVSLPSVYYKKIGNLFRGKLLVLPHDFTLNEALEKMAFYNVSSVPVLKTDEVGEKTLLGFVDVLDILTFLAFTFAGKKKGEDPIHFTQEQTDEFFKNKSDMFKGTELGSVVDFSSRESFSVMHEDSSLLEAVESYLLGIRRIAVINDNQEIIGVLSQWSIANYLATNPSDNREWISSYKCPVKENPFVTSKVIAVTQEELVLNCFLMMHHYNLSSLAIVDKESHKLRGNLSASDLKGFQILEKDSSSFKKPVFEFVANIRRHQNRPADFSVKVSENTEALKVIRLTNKEIVHRAYIVDQRGALCGVISLSDLMKGFVVKDIHTSQNFTSLLSQLQPEQRKQLEQASKVESL